MYEAANLRELVSEIAENYVMATAEPFAGHQLAYFIRHAPKVILAAIPDNEDLTIKGSPGLGQWTSSPWIAVFNRNETDSAQEGTYVVYLFSDDMERVYLAFHQGVTRVIETYGRELGHQKLTSRAMDIRTNFERIEGFLYDDNIKLSASPPGSDYEKATIFYKQYDSVNLPSNEEMIADLKRVISFYEKYLVDSNALLAETDFSDYPGSVEEGKRLLRQHYSRDRNSRLVEEAKRRRLESEGELRCDVCGFSFYEKYGDRGRDFIEAHHIRPIAEMQPGDTTSLDDIALVCSNCHSMLHRKMDNLSVEDLARHIEQ